MRTAKGAHLLGRELANIRHGGLERALPGMAVASRLAGRMASGAAMDDDLAARAGTAAGSHAPAGSRRWR